MNILQLCKFYSPVLGGIELVEKTITKAHRDSEDNVVIVSFSHSREKVLGEFLEEIYLIKQDVFFKSAPISFSFIFNFKAIIKKHKINRIYVHLPNPFMHEVLRHSKRFLKKMKIEVVAVYHSDIVNQKYLGKIYDAYFSLNKNLYTHWICSSQKLWDSSVILNSIDISRKRIIPFCTEGNIEFRKREKFQGKLLAVGRLVPYKGFEFLIKAINKTNYELNIIGDGPEFEKLESLAGKNIILHRRIDDKEKNKLFYDCDLLIVSSLNRAEAYGMIIVEAFESGLPVVASNINSGVTYLVQNEKTGLVFDINNEQKLIEAIHRLENDNELYSAISLNSKQFFESNLKYEHFKTKLKEI